MTSFEVVATLSEADSLARQVVGAIERFRAAQAPDAGKSYFNQAIANLEKTLTLLKSLEAGEEGGDEIARLRAGHFQEWQVDALDRLGHPQFGDGQLKLDWGDWHSRKAFLESLPALLVKQFASSCAEHVLPIWTKEYPDDHRPAQAIQAAKDYLDGKITVEELREKGDAAWAAWAAAWAAAWYAARAARDVAWSARAAAWSARAAARAAEATAWVAADADDAARSAVYAAGPIEYEWQIQELTKAILCSTT